MPRWGIRPTPAEPSLASLFISFVSIGMMSFGGGLAAWTRREVVQKRGWLDDKQFLSGYALSQLVPGATNVNLAVFIGTQMRGTAGAVACFCGLTALPVAIVLALGALYLHSQGHAGGAWLSSALGGMGAVAIGLNLGTGVRLARRNITRTDPGRHHRRRHAVDRHVRLPAGARAAGDDAGQPARGLADPAAMSLVLLQLSACSPGCRCWRSAAAPA